MAEDPMPGPTQHGFLVGNPARRAGALRRHGLGEVHHAAPPSDRQVGGDAQVPAIRLPRRDGSRFPAAYRREMADGRGPYRPGRKLGGSRGPGLGQRPTTRMRMERGAPPRQDASSVSATSDGTVQSPGTLIKIPRGDRHPGERPPADTRRTTGRSSRRGEGRSTGRTRSGSAFRKPPDVVTEGEYQARCDDDDDGDDLGHAGPSINFKRFSGAALPRHEEPEDKGGNETEIVTRR